MLRLLAALLVIAPAVLLPVTPAHAQSAQRATPRYVDGSARGGDGAHRTGRVLTTLAYDVGGMLGAPIAGGLVGCLVGLAASPDLLGFGAGLEFGAIAGEGLALLLLPALDAWVGQQARGRGDAGAAYLGYALGIGVGAALVAGAFALAPEIRDADGRTALEASSIALAALCALFGPIVGYEIGDADARANDPILLPSVSIGPGGARLDLVGRF